MREILPHIKIGLHETGEVVLVVEDYELFDFIDDYLSDECDVSAESFKFADRVGGEVVTAFFAHSTTIEQLEAALSRVSPETVQSIYRLNNDAP